MNPTIIDLTRILPVTDFLRDHRGHLERLQTSGQPIVLTVNGTARVVVHDVVAYQQLLERAAMADVSELLRERLESITHNASDDDAAVILDRVRDALRRHDARIATRTRIAEGADDRRAARTVDEDAVFNASKMRGRSKR